MVSEKIWFEFLHVYDLLTRSRNDLDFQYSQTFMKSMADSSQFSPLTTLSEQLGPNSWVSSVFIPAFIANIGKLFFLKYDYQHSKSI